MKGLEKLLQLKSQYEPESQEYISSLSFRMTEIDELGTMKNTNGWKLLEERIRKELIQRINELVKDDQTIQTLIALLNITDTKEATKRLEAEIENILPN